MIDRKALREKAEAATPGPWKADGWQHESYDGNYFVRGDGVATEEVAHCEGSGRYEENAAYIAAASPDVVLALLDQLAALTAENERLTAHCALVEAREKQATEACTWLTNENQRLRELSTLRKHLDDEIDGVLEDAEEAEVRSVQLENDVARLTAVAGRRTSPRLDCQPRNPRSGVV